MTPRTRHLLRPSPFGSRLPWFALGGALVLAMIAACGDDDGGDAGLGGGGTQVDRDAASSDGAAPPTPSEFGLDQRPSNATCKVPPRPVSAAPVAFQQVFSNLGLPMVLAQRPGDGSRWYVARRGGSLAYFPTASPPTNVNQLVTAANLATISGSPGFTQDGEGGFLGFAFHPHFAQNGKAYVSFTAPPNGTGTMRSVIGELTSTDGGDAFTAYKTVLIFDQSSATNHKGGGLAFGKDGLLYAGFGDGGGGDDPFVNGQKTTGFFSKILRIDVDNPSGGREYGIPAGNPFANGGGEPAAYAYGFRNPFRLSIDRESGDLWVADVGQNQWEEIDVVKAGGNHGWPCREGTHDYITTGNKCPSMVGLVDPVAELKHEPSNNSRSITGGVVYRGKALPDFIGTYVFGDYEQEQLWGLAFDATTSAAKLTRLDEGAGPTANWVSFAEDADGEVYAVALNQSTVYKLVAAPGGQPSTFPDLLSKTGCKDTAGLVPYGVNAELWSDGASKERFMALPDGAKITVKPDGDFEFPNGTVLVKSFKLGGRLVETRLFVRHDDGGWAGYTYEWNDEQTDAVLLRSNKTKDVGGQSWYFPSRGECSRCHTAATGGPLGPELGQLNGELVYAATNRLSNQLRTLEHIGMFDAPLGTPVDQIVAYPAPGGSGPIEGRARAYLHANCSNCHRPEGGGRGTLDLRFATSLAETTACNKDGEAGDLGVAGAKLLAPGDPSRSLLSLRAHAQGANRMPPLASSVVDTSGLAVVDGWITSLTACP